MRLGLLISIGVALLFSCAHKKNMTHFEGLLIYATDDPSLNNVPVDSGQYIKHYIKGDSIRVESYTPFGKQVHMRFTSQKKAYLIFVHNGKKIALIQDLSKDTIQRDFKFQKIKGKENIAGVPSKKGEIRGGFIQDSTIQVYFADHYPRGLIDIYDGIIPGLPTKYTLIIQHFPVSYQLVKIEEKTIDENMFIIPKDCIVLTMEEFLDSIQN
jgi:hypothetical protein